MDEHCPPSSLLQTHKLRSLVHREPCTAYFCVTSATSLTKATLRRKDIRLCILKHSVTGWPCGSRQTVQQQEHAAVFHPFWYTGSPEHKETAGMTCPLQHIQSFQMNATNVQPFRTQAFGEWFIAKPHQQRNVILMLATRNIFSKTRG